MISYEPLKHTLIEKGKSFNWLTNAINDRGLRRKILENKNLSLVTIDKICRVLECDVKDVISYTNEVHKKSWIRGYELDWAKVYDILSKKNLDFCTASRMMHKSPSYLRSLSNSKVTGCRVAKSIAAFLEVDISIISKEIRGDE